MAKGKASARQPNADNTDISREKNKSFHRVDSWLFLFLKYEVRGLNKGKNLVMPRELYVQNE